MSRRSTYSTASTVLALALAIPVVVGAQPGQGGGRDHGERRPDQGAGQANHQPAGRSQDPTQQSHANEGRAPTRSVAPAAQRMEQPGRSPVGNPSQGNGRERPSNSVRQQPARSSPVEAQRNPERQRPTATMQTRSRSTARPASVLKLRRNIQVQHHYRAGQYKMPRGYAQRRWGYGERLPSSYYARNYWISNFLLYSLFAPPLGFVWVRVGNDAFLIDRYDGEIIQARYNVFY